MKYYELMIQYALHESAYLNVAKYYYKIWETPAIKGDEDGKGREVSISQALCVSVCLTEC
jgi:26S proteasome regulatory subunit N5